MTQAEIAEVKAPEFSDLHLEVVDNLECPICGELISSDIRYCVACKDYV